MIKIPTTSNPTFKKGDRAYRVAVCTGRGGCWDHTSESFATTVYAEEVIITSFGAKQGTAVTSRGNLKRRLYVGEVTGVGFSHSRIVHTREEVEAIHAAVGTQESAEAIAANRRIDENWAATYGAPGGSGLPLGRERNRRSLESLAKCVPTLNPIAWC